MAKDFIPGELKDGTRLVAGLKLVSKTEFVVLIQLIRPNGNTETCEIPNSKYGIAGGSFVISPSERFAIFHYYSGQSEEAYALFRLADGFTHLASQDYLHGEVASFCFSADESIMIMALPRTYTDWWETLEEGDPEPDGEGRNLHEFGLVHFLEIATGQKMDHQIKISVPEELIPPQIEYDHDWKPKFLQNGGIGLSMPWGEVELPRELPGIVTIDVNYEE